jgi:hypothetical protein
LKPAKAAGKQKAKSPSLQTSSGKYTSMWDEEHIDGMVVAIQHFKNQLQNKTTQCEQATTKAIRLAHSAQKLPALNAGLEEWESALCAAASTYYNDCFKIVLNHRDDLRDEKPADFANRSTSGFLSDFLRVRALDGEEIDSNGRAREFIRHACEDSTNVGSDPVQGTLFRLPYWVPRRSFGTRLYLSDGFILKAEAKLTAELRAALSRAYDRAVIETAQTPAPRAASAQTAESPRTYKRSDKKCFRQGVIFKALEAGLEGQDYADFLRDNGLTTPDSWSGDGCPESYSLAYMRPGRKVTTGEKKSTKKRAGTPVSTSNWSGKTPRNYAGYSILPTVGLFRSLTIYLRIRCN